MTNNQIYRKFNHQAITSGLSGKQMQCWLLLYELLETKRQQGVCLNTAMLLSMLEVSRSQFFRIRQELEQKGFLTVRITGDKRMYYTLLLEGEVVKFSSADDGKVAVATANDALSVQPEQASANFCAEEVEKPIVPCAKNKKTYPSGDVILTNRYDQWLREFAAAYENNLELWGALKNWAELRKNNGWTLTGWGMEELLHKLADLGKGCATTMAAIVRRSVEKRWKGFYTLRVDSKPSGESLRKQERREEWLNAMRQKTQQVTQKFKHENRDLSMLEL